MEIALSPSGHLYIAADLDGRARKGPASLAEAFERDWREGLFSLSAEKLDSSASPTLRYWQDFADRNLTALCHFPESTTEFEIDAPTEAECATLMLTAPPMRGGEYLSRDVLLSIWRDLDTWTCEAIGASESLSAFLQARAPKWRQVGRVCFHLAENKNDPERPFAFMATYTSGFGAGGRLKHVPLRQALNQYAGARNRPALVRLLSPVQSASERCEWVKELLDSGAVYQPRAWSAAMAYRLLRDATRLEECGLSIRLPDWWKKRARPRVSVTIGSKKKSSFGASAMLDFSAQVALGDEMISEEELEELLASDGGLVLFKGQWVEVDRERLGEALEHWESIQKNAEEGEISFIEGMRLLAGASTDLKHEAEAEADRSWAHVSAGEGMREILTSLRDPARLEAAALDGRLRATLRPYQRDGVTWLRFVTRLGLGACLADDMGLGKTIQVLALLLCLRDEDETRAPSLLVIPASLLGNWRSEAARFAPSLRLAFLHPAENDKKSIAAIAAEPDARLANVDLTVTTYSMLSRQPWLAERKWRLVIADEAQAIKNPSTRQSKALKKLSARAQIALTGTPIENRLGDLWSLFDFLNPGLLGSASVFKSFVKELDERPRDQFAPLRQLVSPYILRRLKTDSSIIDDLPDKTETLRYCRLTKRQVALYEQIVAAMEESLEDTDGIARRGLVLQTLMRLKQVCNHPSQLTGDGEYKPAHSGKFARLAEICEELAERQEKVLVFTQFREIIDPIAEHLAAVFGRSGLILHGGVSVKARQGLVDDFQREDGPPFFILSLKAGGTGLNLTAASHVIHFDRWWNPAVENQATDRAFRIGQRRNVLVHKFVTTGTLEERINDLIEEKRQMSNEVLADGGETKLTELSDDELLDLVRLDVTRAAS